MPAAPDPLLGACGELPEGVGVSQNPVAADDIDTATVTVPCSGCVERAHQIASVQQQAMARAMAEAEARARELRRLAEQRIQACVADKDRAVAGCHLMGQDGAESAGKKRALCKASNPCRVGGAGTRRNTCILQGGSCARIT